MSPENLPVVERQERSIIFQLLIVSTKKLCIVFVLKLFENNARDMPRVDVATAVNDLQHAAEDVDLREKNNKYLCQ